VVLMILLFTALAGMYFIRSIVHPVEEIGRAARRIAKGEYAYRVEKHSNDELGELCDTINYMAAEIQRTERLKNEFISSVSHELRTPLTAIRGWSETLREVGADDPELAQKGMAIITEETDRLSAMVEELLDFSRMQNGRLALQFETVNVRDILDETVLLFRERAEKKGVFLHCAGEGTLPPVSGDAARLRQVFINVLDNAIKYSDAGDTVRVDYATVQKSVQVVFGDTGRGIAAEDLPLIKQKFYKADMTRPGSGIGLAVADEIIKGHGGTLELHSRQTVGTSVIITLPL
jgi:signal transduction histidine kinase